MAVLKAKDIKSMKKTDIDKKLKELKLELVKSRANTGQGSSKTKEIKKAIARLLTLK